MLSFGTEIEDFAVLVVQDSTRQYSTVLQYSTILYCRVQYCSTVLYCLSDTTAELQYSMCHPYVSIMKRSPLSLHPCYVWMIHSTVQVLTTGDYANTSGVPNTSADFSVSVAVSSLQVRTV